ncbi:hypothetical protein EDD28_2746 [Salana multivorans]|uniref:DUF3099 family protein n=1 Tax=Salana multivorans TaxID=120377 RepID=A0A3N2D1H9_9MICO|nr:DUF3099 domain-containing protein [Salana multivorans]MBN8881258.1 DUF3099 domain-containing protein [Salana multivorans]OJX93752.1 MAG: hypothetical protein BGO96_14560 [Micrococcales bacterium 73-15]ROR93334.1 hypothetical protein EDD28_2746 [Salana multivorans]
MTGVPSITSARPSRTLDRATRSRRYMLTMGVRMACFALAIVVDGPWRWAFVVGAVVLPYFAVVLANVASSGGGPGIDEVVEARRIEAGVTVPEPLDDGGEHR